jgi:3',5'-cyclic AMP phosphodiesterase CpdA
MSFSFAHISDHHLLQREDELNLGFAPGYALRRVVDFIGAQLDREIDFVVSSGDFVETANEKSYRLAREVLGLQHNKSGSLGIRTSDGRLPIYCLPGNHDDRRLFYEYLAPHYADQALLNVAFEHQGVNFICLDWGEETKGTAGDETLSFLEQQLDGRPSILLMHHPVVEIGAKWLDAFLADGLERFWKIVEGRSVLACLSGHVHISFTRQVNGINVMGTRSTAYPFALQDEMLICLLPPHIRLVTVNQDGVTSQLLEVPL